MPEQTTQNLQNHTRLDPPFHFVAFPILGINLLYRIYELVRHFIKDDGADVLGLVFGVLVAFALVIVAFKARTYALKAQDRVIRLEERMRMAKILPETLQTRIPELTESQLVASRFASDGELTGLVLTTLDKSLGPKEIKQSIKSWRPDTFRV